MNIFLGRLAIFITLFATWELSSGPLIDPFFVSSPSEIAGKFYELVAHGFAKILRGRGQATRVGIQCGFNHMR